MPGLKQVVSMLYHQSQDVIDFVFREATIFGKFNRSNQALRICRSRLT